MKASDVLLALTDARDVPDSIVKRWLETWPKVAKEFSEAPDLKALGALKRSYSKLIDQNKTDLKDGALKFFYDKRKEELTSGQGVTRSAKDARIDRILRTRDSSGRSKARKF